MSTSPAENPVPGVVTFTARGNAALDQLTEALVADCDGSPTSIADILERVLEADIEDLAESLSETTPASCPCIPGRSRRRGGRAAGPESPDEAARRRLSPRAPHPGDTPGSRGPGIAR